MLMNFLKWRSISDRWICCIIPWLVSKHVFELGQQFFSCLLMRVETSLAKMYILKLLKFSQYKISSANSKFQSCLLVLIVIHISRSISFLAKKNMKWSVLNLVESMVALRQKRLVIETTRIIHQRHLQDVFVHCNQIVSKKGSREVGGLSVAVSTDDPLGRASLTLC